ncbi:protein SPEAR3-like [Momordica charantia]|uniref:Protein SPEAR3-like n=1 Tax=Momordica charantia TaxID=3673 RepID=A0A6J1CTY8_MOMCH|nr:protein SPEAR3-like [Momordica charantia]
MAGSGYFGEQSLGSPSPSPSPRRSGKKSGSGSSSGSDKQPRQPQRGLGVAQLEKIRLHGEIASAAAATASYHPTSYSFNNDQEAVARVQTGYSSMSSSSSSSSPSYAFPSNIMMGFGEYERRNLIDGDSQYSTAARWDPSNGGILESTQHFAQPSMPCYLQNPQAEWRQSRKTKSKRQNNINCEEACDDESQELDLELRLSI